MIEQIRRKDRLLFFPFDSIDPFLRLLEEAADRPDVASIKITIYRLASTSKIARDSLPGGGERERGGGPHGASGSV